MSLPNPNIYRPYFLQNFIEICSIVFAWLNYEQTDTMHLFFIMVRIMNLQGYTHSPIQWSKHFPVSYPHKTFYPNKSSLSQTIRKSLKGYLPLLLCLKMALVKYASRFSSVLWALASKTSSYFGIDENRRWWYFSQLSCLKIRSISYQMDSILYFKVVGLERYWTMGKNRWQ